MDSNTSKKALGARLKAERVRLELSQTEFAALGGVKKLAQLTYEKGERTPSIEYFDRLRTHPSIDVDFILTGATKADIEDGALLGAVLSTLHGFARRAGTSEPVIEEVVTSLLDGPLPKSTEGLVDLLSSGFAKGLDVDLLTRTLLATDDVLATRRIKLSAEKKARVVALVYRAAVLGAMPSSDLIGETIDLANTQA